MKLRDDDKFNMSLRKFVKHVGVTSQQEIERVVREHALRGNGTLVVKMVLTAEGYQSQPHRRRPD